MDTKTLIIGIVLMVMAVVLTICVLLQHGKSHNLSGTIAGGAETFFGKSKGDTIDKKLNVATTIIAIVFVLIVLGAYLIQDTGANTSGNKSDYVAPVTTEAVSGEVTDAQTEAVSEVETTAAATEAVTEAATTVA